MLIMLLLLDLVRFVLGPVSDLDFLAVRPFSRSKEPSLGLLDWVPGWARREALVGILDISFRITDSC